MTMDLFIHSFTYYALIKSIQGLAPIGYLKGMQISYAISVKENRK
jgi:hypothetical protein